VQVEHLLQRLARAQLIQAIKATQENFMALIAVIGTLVLGGLVIAVLKQPGKSQKNRVTKLNIS
jgi:hypothetical protein